MTAVVTGIHSRFACQDGALADGNGTTFDVSHYTYLLAQVTVAGSATVNFEMSADNNTWVACMAQNNATGVVATTATATGHYYVCVAGAQTFRARISSWSSGAVDVDITAFYGTPLLPSAVSTSGASSTAVTSVVPGTGATNLGKAEDAVHSSGDVGVMALAVANDTYSVLAASGDYIPLAADTAGRLANLPAVGNITLGDGVSNSASYFPIGNSGSSGTQLQYVPSLNYLYDNTDWDRVRSIITGTNSTGTGIQAVGLVAQFDDASPTAITENQFGNVRMSVTHDIRTSYPVPEASAVIAPSTYKDAGTVTKANIKASAGNVFSFYITNENAAVRYFQLHNKATAPAAAETAQLYFPIPAGTAAAPTVLIIGVDFFAPSERFATGIGWAISTTATTFTDSATASEHDVTVRYV